MLAAVGKSVQRRGYWVLSSDGWVVREWKGQGGHIYTESRWAGVPPCVRVNLMGNAGDLGRFGAPAKASEGDLLTDLERHNRVEYNLPIATSTLQEK